MAQGCGGVVQGVEGCKWRRKGVRGGARVWRGGMVGQ